METATSGEGAKGEGGRGGVEMVRERRRQAHEV